MQAEMLAASDESPARKIRKVTRACDACKRKKKACTGYLPCRPCLRRKEVCTYNTTYNRGVAVSPPPSSHTTHHTTLQGATENYPQDSHLPFSSPASYTSPGKILSAPYHDAPASVISPPSITDTRHHHHHEPELQRAQVADQYWGPTSAHSFLDRAALGLPTPPSNAIGASHDPSHGPATVPMARLRDGGSLVHRYFEFASPTHRVLHQQTVEKTVRRLYQCGRPGEDRIGGVTSVCQAILLMVFSTATMFKMDIKGAMTDADEDGWRTSELYFTKADDLLSQESGAPRLESVQARFLMVLYLLSSSRAHRAWFTLGTAIQLIMALGLHSRRRNRDTPEVNLIQQECQRRVVWCSYTLDKYLSLMLGTPRLWHDEDLDERLPARVNDEDISPDRISPPTRDCVMDAAIFHALLARVLSQAAKEPYVVAGITDREEINIIRGLCERVAEWHAELPPCLSGVIHSSSLIPLFKRQLTVLQLARYHALMFITRPLLLRNYGQIWTDREASYGQYLRVCLMAAKDTVELITTFARDNQLFPAFWYSQYIAFNALSIIYIYLIQVRCNRILPLSQTYVAPEGGLNHGLGFDESTLYILAETAQYHLTHATARNAPSWKYGTILQSLRRELERLGAPCDYVALNAPPEQHGGPRIEDRNLDNTASGGNISHTHPEPRYHEPFPVDAQTLPLFDTFTLDNDLILDLWSQLDSLPISAYPACQSSVSLKLTVAYLALPG
ncbi:Zn(II)2Cys6 transcription factor [Aspergillus bombycis]|uniref:Zn(II)2Cys6 transcription factor n=1 Tax=Aspergillus bombycis TaxID=109264 RepID=A0A1F8AAY8_9EURO|nr:Zn(II)2Cys6 transcription factor [Aspergillus bombycis]OGM48880.1 Zn(II)2Cys6 transcription factor [Aspergillus bombycis]